MKFELIDLFCGAGGVTTGIENARYKKQKIANVIACINHDPRAIESHSANHQGVLHFTEDIKTFDVTKFPAWSADAITCLWASLECTNFSKAKGGKPRDGDSRTLANHMFKYLEHLKPDYFLVENVEEFEAWGALDEHGKPVSRDNGRAYRRWCNKVEAMGYTRDRRKLNAADFGANTIRKRLFIIFAKTGFPIAWAQPTHTKSPDMYVKKAWKPVKECLDFSDEGYSVFDRKDNASIPKRFRRNIGRKTFKRLLPGLKLAVSKDSDNWILKYNSINGKTGKHVPPQINDPSPALNTQGRIGLVNLNKAFALLQPQHIAAEPFISSYYGNGNNITRLSNPAGTVTTKDRMAFIKPINFIDLQYSNGKQNQPIDQPAGSITSVPKHKLIKAERVCILNPQWGSSVRSVNKPMHTLIARMDKAPPYLISFESGEVAIEIYKHDYPEVVEIKKFMAAYGIIDIKMRMLKVPELLKIQGFPKKYKLIGSQADRKKFIGNSVVPVVAQRIIEALYLPNLKIYKNAA